MTEPMISNCVAYAADGRKLRDITLDEISDVLEQPDTFVWIGTVEPDAALLEKLREEFGLHALAIEDAQHAHQRPKIEAYGDSLFIVVRTAQLQDGNIEFGETHLFLGARYLVSVRHGTSLSYLPARRNCETKPELLALGPSYGLYAVLDFIVDNYLPIVEDFKQELQALEQNIFAETYKRDTIRRLYDMQRELLTLKLAVAPLQDILNQLMQLHPGLIKDGVRIYFRDVYDHVFRVNEAINAMREMLGAALTVNLSLVNVRQNEVVKRLAGWAALLAVPTLLASWYGMNFRDMPELNTPWAYPALGMIAVAICIGLYIVLKRAKWL
jgi:magnesium transporter